MPNEKIPLPLDIYDKHLRSINGIEFTPREIDVISCILNRRGSSIAPFLSIGQRSVETHIRNIRQKAGGLLGREQIIDFIEKSGKLSLIKNEYYFSLRLRILFERMLEEISKKMRFQPSSCLLMHEKEQSKQSFLIPYLKEHLKKIGCKVKTHCFNEGEPFLTLISGLENSNEGYWVLCILPEDFDTSQLRQINTTQISNAVFILHRNIPLEKIHQDLNFINIGETENYYLSFFEILKVLFPQHNWKHVITEFETQVHGISQETEKVYDDGPSNDLSPENRERLKNITTTYFYGISSSLLLKRKVALLIGLTFSLMIFLSYLLMSKERQESGPLKNVSYVRSDLLLPYETVLLQRPEILREIDEKLNGQRGIQSIAIIGQGGAGKTTLARQYAHNQKGNIVWEINAETATSLTESFENLAHALSKEEKDKKILREILEIKDVTEREKKVISFVKEQLKFHSNWLLIYDNMEDFSDLQAYFPIDTNLWGNGKVIITTQNHNIQNNRRVNEIILLGELSPTQKLSLYTQIMNQGKTHAFNISQENKLMEFLKQLPPFPLDISVAAYYLKTINISYTQYLENLKQQDKDFTIVQKNLLKEAGEYTKTRYAIITHSLELLLKSHKEFADLLLFISLLDSQNIPKTLLDQYKSPGVVDNFIYHLKKYSLITAQRLSSSEVTYSLHRSTQAISSVYLTKLLKLNEESPILKKIVDTLHNYSDKAINKEEFHKMKILLQHLEFFLKNKELLSNDAEGTIRGDIGTLLFYLSQHITAQKFLKEALKLSIYKKENFARIARYSGYLGCSYRELGDYKKAKLYLEKTLHIFQKDIAEEQKDLPWILVNLGLLYRYMEDYKSAKIYMEKALEIKQKLHVDEETHTAWILGNLGGIYRRLGNNKQAKALFEQSLAMYERNYDMHHPKRAWTLLGLGTVFRNLSDLEKAKTFIEEALEIYKLHFSEDNLKVSFALLELAQVYLLEDKLDIAETLLHKSLVGFKKNKLNDFYMALELLAELYLKKTNSIINAGEVKKAQYFKIQSINYLKQALEIVTTYFPADSPHIERIQVKLKKLQQVFPEITKAVSNLSRNQPIASSS